MAVCSAPAHRKGEKKKISPPEEDRVLGGPADPSTHAALPWVLLGVLSPQQQKHSLPMLESRSKLVNEMRTETNPGRDPSADPGVAN